MAQYGVDEKDGCDEKVSSCLDSTLLLKEGGLVTLLNYIFADFALLLLREKRVRSVI